MSSASSTWLDRLPLIGAMIVLALVVAAVIVAGHNRGLQEQVAAGQQRVAAAQTAGNLNNSLIRLLAGAAADHDDADIKALLAQNGITFKQNAKPTAPTADDAKDAGEGAK